jgi:hypothetical protein
VHWGGDMANETGAPHNVYSEAAVLRQSRDLYPVSIPVEKVSDIQGFQGWLLR